MILKKIWKRISWNFYIKRGEKRFGPLKYLYLKGDPKKPLLVIFSGFPPEGKPARYNYIRTLQGIDANKLFILDDFGYQKRGSYYLGENGDWFLPPLVTRLIQKVKEETKTSEIITIGSSKGGTAALYYAISCGAKSAVLGAPQYHLGDYLNLEENRNVLFGIMGSNAEESIKKLNELIPSAIGDCGPDKPKVYIHYSPKEHTYQEHIFDMICALKDCGFCVTEDNEYSYENHSDVARHFPEFMVKIINENWK